MLKTGTCVLFQEPTSEARLLRRSNVIETEAEGFTVDFGEQPIPLTAGRELLCYFEGEREFMQQLVRVVEVLADKPRLVAKLATLGDSISAESRESHRVSTISADILAALGEERQLCVQDVSTTGFAVVAKGWYPIGTTFPVSITFESDIYSGLASVQSVRELRPGHVRYGLLALDDHPEAGDLLDGLHAIRLAVQRARLKRNSSGTD